MKYKQLEWIQTDDGKFIAECKLGGSKIGIFVAKDGEKYFQSLVHEHSPDEFENMKKGKFGIELAKHFCQQDYNEFQQKMINLGGKK